MAAVVVAIRNKQYDAEEAQDVLLDSKDLITPVPQESDWLGDLVLEKLMIDGCGVQCGRATPSTTAPRPFMTSALALGRTWQLRRMVYTKETIVFSRVGDQAPPYPPSRAAPPSSFLL